MFIDLETLRVRYISEVLDGSKIQAIKVDAFVKGAYKRSEIAWIKPGVFLSLIPGKLGDRDLPRKLKSVLLNEWQEQALTLSMARSDVKRLVRLQKSSELATVGRITAVTLRGSPGLSD